MSCVSTVRRWDIGPGTAPTISFATSTVMREAAEGGCCCRGLSRCLKPGHKVADCPMLREGDEVTMVDEEEDDDRAFE